MKNFLQKLIIIEILFGFMVFSYAQRLHPWDKNRQLMEAQLEQGKYKKALLSAQKCEDIAQKFFGSSHQKAWQSTYFIAWSYYKMAEYNKALRFAQRVFKKQHRELKKRHPDTLKTWSLLGKIHNEQSNYAPALSVFKTVLNLRVKILGKRHPDTLNSFHDIAKVYFHQKKYDKALELYQKVLRNRKSFMGATHPDTFSTMNAIAQVHFYKRNYKQALTLYEEVLNKRKKILGERHIGTLLTLDAMAKVYSSQEKYQQVFSVYKQMLEIAQNSFGYSHPFTRKLIYDLASTYLDQQKPKLALSLLKKSIKSLSRSLEKFHPAVLKLTHMLAMSYLRSGEYEKGVSTLEDTLKLKIQRFGDKSLSTIETFEYTAEFYFEAGQYARAIIRQLQTIQYRAALFTERHPDTIQSFAKLADMYYQLGFYKEALEKYEKVLKLRRETLGEDHKDSLIAMSDIAKLNHSFEKYKKAVKLYLEILKIQKETLGEEHPDVLETVDKLAFTYIKLGKNKEALKLLAKNLPLKKKQFGENHSQVATTMAFQALSYLETKEYEKTLKIFQKILQIRIKTFGEKHRKTLQAMLGVAGAYAIAKRYKKAAAILNKSLKLHKEAFGPKHKETLKTMRYLGEVLMEQEKGNKALVLFLKVFEIRKKELGQKNPYTMESMVDLARVYSRLGQYDKSAIYFRRAINLIADILGERHAISIAAKNYLAAEYVRQGKFDKALKIYQKSLKLCEKKFGAEHFVTIDSLTGLSVVYFLQGDLQKSLKILKEQIKLQRKTLGEDHVAVLSTLFDIGLIYYHQGAFKKTLKNWKEAFKLVRKKKGKDHSETLATMSSIAHVYYKMGEYKKSISWLQQIQKIGFKKVEEDQELFIASVACSLARSYTKIQKLGKAKDLLQKILKKQNKKEKELWTTLAPQEELAQIHYYQKDYKKAQQLAQAPAKVWKNLHWQNRARLISKASLLTQRNFSNAKKQAEKLFVAENKALKQEIKSLPAREKLERIGYLNDIHDLLLTLCSMKKQKDLSLFLAKTIYCKNIANSLLFQEQKLFEKLNNSKRLHTLQNYYQNLEEAIIYLQFVNSALAKKHKPHHIKHLKKMKGRLQKEIFSISKGFKFTFLKSNENLVKQIQSKISSKSAILEFVEFTHFTQQKPWIGVFVVKPQKIYFFSLGERAKIRAQVQKVLSSIYKFPKQLSTIDAAKRKAFVSKQEYTLAKRSQNLYETLFPLGVKSVLEGTSLLFIAPDDCLHLLPFAALCSLKGKQKKYLIEEYDLLYLASTDLLKRNQREGKGFLAISNPKFKTENANGKVQLEWSWEKFMPHITQEFLQKQDWQPLEESKTLSTIQKTYTEKYKKDAQVTKQGVEAAKEFLNDEAKGKRWLHITTHAFFMAPVQVSTLFTSPRQYNPMYLSGLAMSGARQADAASYLFARDIALLDLQGVKCTVLSHCNVSLYQGLKGNAISTFKAAFANAGTHSLLTSLWKMPPKFLQKVYQNAVKMPAWKALIQSQKQYLKQSDYSHPYFWAGYISQGKPAPGEEYSIVGKNKETPLSKVAKKNLSLVGIAVVAALLLIIVVIVIKKKKAKQNANSATANFAMPGISAPSFTYSASPLSTPKRPKTGKRKKKKIKPVDLIMGIILIVLLVLYVLLENTLQEIAPDQIARSTTYQNLKENLGYMWKLQEQKKYHKLAPVHLKIKRDLTKLRDQFGREKVAGEILNLTSDPKLKDFAQIDQFVEDPDKYLENAKEKEQERQQKSRKATYLFITRLKITKKNEDGQHWDKKGGKPDIIITFAQKKRKKWKRFYQSNTITNTHKIIFFKDPIKVPTNIPIQIQVIDKDPFNNEKIGTHTFTVKSKDLSTKERQENASFGMVLSFKYFLSKHSSWKKTRFFAAFNLKRKAQEHFKAVQKQNYKKIVALADPEIIKLLGGKDTAAEFFEISNQAIERELTDLKVSVSYSNMELGSISRLVKWKKKIYSAVSMIIPATVDDKRKKIKGSFYMVVIAVSRNKGKSWFITNYSKATRKYFARFPVVFEKLQIPDVKYIAVNKEGRGISEVIVAGNKE